MVEVHIEGRRCVVGKKSWRLARTGLGHSFQITLTNKRRTFFIVRKRLSF